MTPQEKRVLYTQVGYRLKQLREDAHLTQDNFAEILGLSRASIINIEKGRQCPTLHFLIDAAKTLKITVADLLASIEDHTTTVSDRLKSEKWKQTIAQSTSGSPSAKKKVTNFLKELANK